jgi:hypothetical protein
MAKIYGQLPGAARRGLVSALMARLSETARLQVEMEEGEGLRRLFPLLEALPDNVTVVLKPTLGFMRIDCCIIGPGRIIVLKTAHYKGTVKAGEQGEWRGGAGTIDLGRPDRLANTFCDRLQFSGNARGFAVEPVVIFTAGPVEFEAGTPLATLVPWEEAAGFLTVQFPDGVDGFSPEALITLLTT